MPRRLQPFSVLPAALLAVAAGCAPVTLDVIQADVGRGQAYLLGEVPFVPQEEYQCGPAALAMVLRYHGVDADRDEIGRALYLPSVAGALNVELEFYARRRGLRTLAFEGTLVRAKDELRRGHPLIVFQDLAAVLPGVRLSPVPHFAVLIGYDDRAGVVVLHSGTTPYRILSYAEFERTWAARRSWALLVTPPGPGA